jgi:hypothetical protein
MEMTAPTKLFDKTAADVAPSQSLASVLDDKEHCIDVGDFAGSRAPLFNKLSTASHLFDTMVGRLHKHIIDAGKGEVLRRDRDLRRLEKCYCEFLWTQLLASFFLRRGGRRGSCQYRAAVFDQLL